MSKQAIINMGKRIFVHGLVDGASGNISVKEGNKILITKSGSFLGGLDEQSIITVNLGEKTDEASSDYPVHETIYRKTDFNAVIHCHGVFNVILSLTEDRITPLDFEGRIILGEVEIIHGEFGSREYADIIAAEIKRSGVVLSKGHGIYSAGKNLDEAFNRADYVEHSCKILYFHKLLKK
jgi:L-fuculose-phosphate aldolase